MDNANAIKKALKQGVDKGKLLQKGQSFTIPGVEFQAPADEQVTIEESKVGDGDVAERGSEVTIEYRGTLEADGSEFDAASRFDFTLGAGEVIKGWDKGIEGMRVGGKRRLVIPRSSGTASAGVRRRSGDATSCSKSNCSPCDERNERRRGRREGGVRRNDAKRCREWRSD